MAMQLFAVSPDPDETEAVPSDTDRTPDVQLHFSADCRMRNNIIQHNIIIILYNIIKLLF